MNAAARASKSLCRTWRYIDWVRAGESNERGAKGADRHGWIGTEMVNARTDAEGQMRTWSPLPPAWRVVSQAGGSWVRVGEVTW